MKKTEYKPMRRPLDFVMAALLLIVAVVFIYARVSGGQVEARSAGVMTRRAVPSIMFMDETLDIQLRLDPRGLPRCQMSPASTNPVYTTLVLDTSGSMGGSPLENAKTAAVEFVDLLDMDIDRVGLVQFTDTASTLARFTASRESVVASIERLSSGNMTNMGDGLQQAYQMIQGTSIPQGATRLVVLLSDGRPNVGPDPVSISQQIRRAGFRMTAIALGNADKNYLAGLVDNPSEDVIASGGPTQLVQSFGQIAKRVVNSLATDVQLREVYNDAAFALVPNSARGTDTSIVGTIRWSWAFLGDRGRNTGYRLRPRTLGMLRVVDDPVGDMSLKDCTGQMLGQSLPPDPIILVLPPLWALYLPLALALLWALYRFLEEIRFGKSPVAVDPPGQPTSVRMSPPAKASSRGSPTGYWHGRQDI